MGARKLRPETQVVEMPPWLKSVYTKWQERNNDPNITPKLPFSSFMATRDDLMKQGSRVDQEVKNILQDLMKLGSRVDQEVKNILQDNQRLRNEMVKMRLEHAKVILTLKTDFQSATEALSETMKREMDVIRQDQVDVQVEGLKEPRSQEAFDVVRKVLYSFNKRNAKRKKQGKQPLKFGKDLEYSEISDKESLVAWLDSDFARAHGFGNVIEEFEVCVFRGELATISTEFKGGVGIEAFWVPDDKYDQYLTRSTCYESTKSISKDPRHGYMLNGVRWVPSTGTSKRKVADQ